MLAASLSLEEKQKFLSTVSRMWNPEAEPKFESWLHYCLVMRLGQLLYLLQLLFPRLKNGDTIYIN